MSLETVVYWELTLPMHRIRIRAGKKAKELLDYLMIIQKGKGFLNKAFITIKRFCFLITCILVSVSTISIRTRKGIRFPQSRSYRRLLSAGTELGSSAKV